MEYQSKKQEYQSKLIRIDNHQQTLIHQGDRSSCWRLKVAYDKSPRMSQINHIVIITK